MQFLRIVFGILIICLSTNCTAQVVAADTLVPAMGTVPADTVAAAAEKTAPEKPQVVKPKRRIVAAFLCITLGPFGMHRLYLGTKPHVAAAYTLTLGGGVGIIPLIDLFHIVFSRDLERFKNNDRFIMWVKP